MKNDSKFIPVSLGLVEAILHLISTEFRSIGVFNYSSFFI